jgi:two-component system, sensor histidine kinase and response regulator
VTTAPPLRLLIVEDDIVDRKQLERLLAQSSLGPCEVKNADRLSAALDLLKEFSFDVVLLDLGLPDSQGMDSVSGLQAHSPLLPIIVLSGLDDENTATQAVHMGVQDYLIKGQVDASLLMRAIRYALERKKAERQLQAAELRYRTIFDNSAVAIMMADEGRRLVSWNTFTERLLHMDRDQLHGRDVKTLYPDSEWQRICALGIRRMGMRHHLETKMICGNGDVIDVDISLSVVHDSDGGVTGTIGVIRDITERKHMEEALRRSERRFRQVAENAREWIWEVDAEGRYTYASPVVEKILGYKVEEILGKRHFHDFFHPDDADRLQTKSSGILSRKDVFSEFQMRAVRKDGAVVWLLRSGVPILDENQVLLGYRGADADITERMRTHEILDRKQKNLEAIFDAVPLGMFLVNERMRVVRANDAIRQMSGKEYPQIIDHDPCEVLGCPRTPGSSEDPGAGSADCCSLRGMVQAVFASGQSVRGAEIRPPLQENGGDARPWFAVSAESVNIDGAKHVVIALNDITDRKRAEEELRNTLELKAQFISTVSHELRTPLTSMKESVVIVRDGVAGKINKDQAHFLDIAKRNTDRLARMIDDVLDFQKLHSGRMKFHMQENSIAVTVDDAFNTMRPHAATSGVHLGVDLEHNLPVAVYDNDRMAQVLINLISNAIKFTPERGRVLVSAHRQQEHMILKVSDTGYGIPKEDLSKVFDQFYRVHRPGKEIKGTGLGLAIVNKIVTAHGGRIEVESELGRGTTFTVFLPLAPPCAPAPAPSQADQSLEAVLAGK